MAETPNDPYAVVNRNTGLYDLATNPDTYNLEGFHPSTDPPVECVDLPAWGVPSPLYSYIFKGSVDESTYPEGVCPPYYHSTAQIDSLRVNVSIQGPAGTGPISINSSLVTIPNGDIVSNAFGVEHFLSLKKNFDIPHPTKDGWRLRHTCPEGPSNDVYVRGKIKGQNIIKLPEFWSGLVDPESITVSLTCIGSHQPLSYEIKWGREVHVTNADAGPIHCSYIIFGERKDGEKLIPEYEGTTPADYPGNNDEYSVVGYNYDKRN